MSYEPTIWECGDVVTAERLNHMEEGIEAANACCEGGSGNEPLLVQSLVMTAEEITEAGLTGVEIGSAYRLDTTTEAILEAFNSGRLVYLMQVNLANPNKSSTRMMVFVGQDSVGGAIGFSSNDDIDMWRFTSSYPYPVKVIQSVNPEE